MNDYAEKKKEINLVELVLLKEGKFRKKGNGGGEISVTPVTPPIIVSLNGATREPGRTYEQNVERIIFEDPRRGEADAYHRGEQKGIYLSLVYYKIN